MCLVFLVIKIALYLIFPKVLLIPNTKEPLSKVSVRDLKLTGKLSNYIKSLNKAQFEGDTTSGNSRKEFNIRKCKRASIRSSTRAYHSRTS